MQPNNPPPSKSSAKPQFWLMKLPKWLADEWWSEQYLVNQPVATMKIFEQKDPEKPPHVTLQLPDHQPEQKATQIPIDFTLRKREVRRRHNVKNGEVHWKHDNKLLVFYDKPQFAIGQRVEAQNSNEKKYCPGVIEHITADRKYTVYFDETDDRKVNTPATSIRAAVEDPKSDKCRLGGKIKNEWDVQPDRSDRYLRFTAQRNSKSQQRQSVKWKQVVKKYEGGAAAREDRARKKILGNKRQQTKTEKQTGRPKQKRVRREREIYEDLIFRAFEGKVYLSKEELMKAVEEDRWNFIKDIVSSQCNYHSSGVHKHTFSLKSEFKLADDATENPPDS